MKAIRISETGGPEVMHLEEIETPTPKEGEVLVKVAAAGINYADIAQRQGTYLTRTRPPTTLGMEFAGTVAALGPGVSGPAEGTRVVGLGEGADVAVNYTEENWVERVKNATQGRGADIILEMAGGEIAEQSLQCLAPYGRMVVFGAASGQIVQFSGVQLMYKNQAIIGYWLTS